VGQESAVSVVLDAGALIAFERGSPRVRALLEEALRTNAKLLVPAGVLGQVWRDSARQVVLRALLGSRVTEVVPLDRLLAEASGILCGKSATADVIDASVVLCALRARAVVITSDARDLKRLHPSLSIESV
jgi:hypothetical protein